MLRTLNEAALAMQRALTPEEIFTTVAEELKKLGFSCMVFLTDENQSRLFTKYLSYETSALRAAEKLVGLQHENFSIPIETVDVYRKVVWEKRTVSGLKRIAGPRAAMLPLRPGSLARR